MHFDLKPISVESIPEALARVERYRLLNEPGLAESICMDILEIVPDHQQALISLLLARTDQFGSEMNATKAREVLPQIKGEYERAYYAGIIFERRAKAQLVNLGLVQPDESEAVNRVLNAAALTYVAALVTSVLALLRLLMIARNRD